MYFCIERRGRVTESCHDDIYMHVNYLPTWNLKPHYKKYMQRICMPVPKEKAPSKTEMIGASSDF